MAPFIQQPIDFLATLASYGFRVDTRAAFEALPETTNWLDALDGSPRRFAGLRERAAAHPGSHVLWDPDDDADGFMLCGDDPETLARTWWDACGCEYEGTPTLAGGR